MPTNGKKIAGKKNRNFVGKQLAQLEPAGNHRAFPYSCKWSTDANGVKYEGPLNSTKSMWARGSAQNRRTHHYQVLLASIPSVRDIIEAPLGSNKLKWSPQFILHTQTAWYFLFKKILELANVLIFTQPKPPVSLTVALNCYNIINAAHATTQRNRWNIPTSPDILVFSYATERCWRDNEDIIWFPIQL